MAARWVVHDLRSPAQSLALVADLLEEPGAEVEAILRDSCGHMSRSLDLLSRVIHPLSPLDLGPVSIRQPIQFVADLHNLGRTSARLELSLEPGVPAVTGIERHLEHALLNLVLNADEALRGQSRGVIRIATGCEDGKVEVVVADNGPGLPADIAESLFEARVTTKTFNPLAGYGLIVARELVAMCGGTLAYAPEPGRGAKFVITLPLWMRTPVQTGV